MFEMRQKGACEFWCVSIVYYERRSWSFGAKCTVALRDFLCFLAICFRLFRLLRFDVCAVVSYWLYCFSKCVDTCWISLLRSGIYKFFNSSTRYIFIFCTTLPSHYRLQRTLFAYLRNSDRFAQTSGPTESSGTGSIRYSPRRMKGSWRTTPAMTAPRRD